MKPQHSVLQVDNHRSLLAVLHDGNEVYAVPNVDKSKMMCSDTSLRSYYWYYNIGRVSKLLQYSTSVNDFKTAIFSS